MSEARRFHIRPFVIEDQSVARQIILDGLKEHFHELDEQLNADLLDIHSYYAAEGHLFLVAELEGRLVGVGALIQTGDEAQIVRVSVARPYRRRGIARCIVGTLIREGRERKLTSVWMETNDDWAGAIALYESIGFCPFDRRDGCIFMRLNLMAQPQSTELRREG